MRYELNNAFDTLLLLSGGLDSSVLAHALAKEHKKRIRGLFFNFGGEANSNGLGAARKVALDLGFPLEVVPLDGLVDAMNGYDSTVRYIDLEAQMKNATTVRMSPPSGFPSLLAMASYFAHGVKVNEVALGVTAEQVELIPELSDLLEGLSKVLHAWAPKHPRISFTTPFSNFTKAQIVAKGGELCVPLGETWSCYFGRYAHDGTCLGCIDRRRAFTQAEVEDPTEYADGPAAESGRLRHSRI